MNKPNAKSSLSNPQQQLLELLQNINFGRIEDLHVRSGQPDFESSPPRIIRKLKIGGENGPRLEAQFTDFRLKEQLQELFAAISQLGDSDVITIEVKHGLPFTVEVEQGSVSKEGFNG